MASRSAINAKHVISLEYPDRPIVAALSGAAPNVAHLAANIESILRPLLPKANVARLHELFGALTVVGLDLPDHNV